MQLSTEEVFLLIYILDCVTEAPEHSSKPAWREVRMKLTVPEVVLLPKLAMRLRTALKHKFDD